MKRPLLVAGLAVAVIAAVRLKAGGPDALWGQPETAYPASGENVVITGQVCQKDEKTFSVKSVILYQTNQEAAISQQRIPFRKKIVCEVTDTGVVTLGGTVALKGTFEAYSAASNPGEFDSAAYYRSIGVIGKLRKAEILSQKQPFLCIREKLYRLKCYWKERLYSIFLDEQAAIMCALLLGDKSELDGGLKELYRRNGILHILSISG